ncbi:MAG: type IV pilus modification PilV family protein [Planctomycetota bacterium]|jgi:prepilin-type N-terminal cleavage/methylation domain-containing protein
MGDYYCNRSRGMTLIEVLVATVIVCVAAAGVLSYEYHAAKQIRMAFAKIEAVRLGHLVLEDWKANGGSEMYAVGVLSNPSPLDMDMGFLRIDNGVYRVTAGDTPMQVTLERPSQYRNPVPIKVTVQWRKDFCDGQIFSNDPAVVLNTYARPEQTGG